MRKNEKQHEVGMVSRKLSSLMKTAREVGEDAAATLGEVVGKSIARSTGKIRVPRVTGDLKIYKP